MRKVEQREIISINLKDLLRSRKLTAKQVASDLNVSYSTFGDWTRGRTSPSASQLKDVADYFKVSIGNLTSLNEDFSTPVSDAEILDSKVRISVLESAVRDGEEVNRAFRWEYIPKFLVGNEHAIGIMLNDDSMEPEYHKGDIIIARKVKYLNSNKDYILESYDGDEWIPSYQFARVIQKGNKVLITPLNNDNEKCFVPERLTESEYLKKYKNIYSIIRLIRDYEKYR